MSKAPLPLSKPYANRKPGFGIFQGQAPRTPQVSFSRQARKDAWFVSVDGVLNWTLVVKNLDAFLNYDVKEAFLTDDAPSFDGWVCLAHGTNEVLGFGSTREEAARKGL